MAEQNKHNIEQRAGRIYELAVTALTGKIGERITEEALRYPEDKAVVVASGQTYMQLDGYTDKTGASTLVVNNLTPKPDELDWRRYEIANGIVTHVVEDPLNNKRISREKVDLEVINNLRKTINGAKAVHGSDLEKLNVQGAEHFDLPPENDRGELPYGVEYAESLPIVGEPVEFTEDDSSRISRKNNQGPLRKLGNAVTKSIVGK